MLAQRHSLRQLENGCIYTLYSYPYTLYNFAMRYLLTSILLTATVLFPALSQAEPIPDFAKGKFSISLWFKTKDDGPLYARTKAEGVWVKQGKTLFIKGGRLNYDIGWVGCNRGKTDVTDNQWHHVIFTSGDKKAIYLDGKAEINVTLESPEDPLDSVFKIGTCSDNFPLDGNDFNGLIDDVRIFSRALDEEEIIALAKGSALDLELNHQTKQPQQNDSSQLSSKSRADPKTAHWPLDGEMKDIVSGSKLYTRGQTTFADGRLGKALRFSFDVKQVSNALIQPGRLDMSANLQGGKPFGFEKLLFVKRYTYTSNHYYTEFINGEWHPGGNLCLLDLKSGAVTDLVPELKEGVFERFDLDFDARHIVFAWKSAAQTGYRLYEIEINPQTGERIGELKQLTFPQTDEAELVKLYRVFDHYHHGTDDMHPCYLPDGDICFISTRCQYGILCDGPDDFTTTLIYRLSRKDGSLRKLSNGSVSEASPSILPDGRIMYTRWEYVDKGAVSVKCLWAMQPDGSNSAEIYGNDIALPPTFLYGRPIPGKLNHYCFLGTPHCPQNGVGTVITIDMNKDIRTRDPMTYITPYVDIRSEPGFDFKTESGRWKTDRKGQGVLFKDPYPLSERLFLVSSKPNGPEWNDLHAYGLSLLNEKGAVADIYRDKEFSCWMPYPLQKRTRPPVLKTNIEKEIADRNLARCVVTDIYHGMENVKRGSVKYIRVIEQIPRPWATRRRWPGDGYDQQHAVITKDTHLGLKVQHGIVPVEEDGSAHFLVPANANIILQALDANCMALQTERTFVNYIPGEVRSCIGCHEKPNDAVALRSSGVAMALKREASLPAAQPGEERGQRPLDFMADVQPVLNKHCIECHSGKEPKAGLDLSGELTQYFCRSYESLLPERRGGQGRKNTCFPLVGPTIGENHPKTGNVDYLPARSIGSHNSILVAMLAPDAVTLADPEEREIAAKLAKKHEKVKLTQPELLKLTNWIDTNGQYYGMYWGRRNLQHKDHPNFRPKPTFKRASSYVSEIPEEER